MTRPHDTGAKSSSNGFDITWLSWLPGYRAHNRLGHGTSLPKRNQVSSY